MPTIVPNLFPTRPSNVRIAFVGEALGQDEERLGVPFIGSSGWLLSSTLSAVGLSREEVFVGNVCQVRPPGNHLYAWPWTDARIQDGIAALVVDLTAYRPNIIVALGNVPLHLLRHGNVDPGRGAGGFNWPSKIGAWRGSLFLTVEGLLPWRCKAMAAYHPAFILRTWSKVFDFRQDLKRARDEGGTAALVEELVEIEWGPV